MTMLYSGRLTLLNVATKRTDLKALEGGQFYPNRLVLGKGAIFTDVNKTRHIVETSPVKQINVYRINGRNGITVCTENTIYKSEEAL